MRKTLTLCLLLATMACGEVRAQAGHNGRIARNLELLSDIYRQLDLNYVDTLNADTVLYWAVQKMLGEVDPFTEYFSEADMQDFKTLSTGKYGGVGSLIRYDKKLKRCTIDEPYEGTPSDKAGLRAGDIIMSIDGKDTEGWPTKQVSETMRGEAGTSFQMVVQRPGEKKARTLLLTRETIQQPQVPYYGQVAPGVGYIFLTGFTEGAAQEVRFAFNVLRAEGIRSLILDLRGNGGGSVSEAVDIINMVTPKGRRVVYTKGKIEANNHDYYTSAEPIDTLLPMAVVVDGTSASASEIVAGALQDMDRATIVGQRTYGKGLVQGMRDVGDNGILKLTIARYYIPSGRCIQAYDYRHLNADGSVGTVPDSLTHVFHTASGREVRDGGGIKPDIVLEDDTLATIVYDFAFSDQLFDFCTRYVREHKKIAPAGEIALSDKDYDDFIAFMQGSDFKYNNRSDNLLTVLKTVAKREGFYDDAQAEFAALEAKFKTDLATDLRRHRTDIEKQICDELATRYYYQRGGVAQNIKGDPYVRAAMEAIMP